MIQTTKTERLQNHQQYHLEIIDYLDHYLIEHAKTYYNSINDSKCETK